MPVKFTSQSAPPYPTLPSPSLYGGVKTLLRLQIAQNVTEVRKTRVRKRFRGSATGVAVLIRLAPQNPINVEPFRNTEEKVSDTFSECVSSY